MDAAWSPRRPRPVTDYFDQLQNGARVMSSAPPPVPRVRSPTPEHAQVAAAIETEVGAVIVGQHELVRTVVTCLLCEGHALLEGVPGLGKTLLLKTLAQVVDLPFAASSSRPTSCPPTSSARRCWWRTSTATARSEFRPGPVFASFVLADEINRATPKTQSALLEAMQERSGHRRRRDPPLPRPFLVMATQNPIEMEGTYPLPEAQLDRFLLKALVPFPSADDLVTVLERTTGTARRPAAQVAEPPTLGAMIELTRQVPIASHVCATPSTWSWPPTRARRATRRGHALRALRRVAPWRPGAGAGGQGRGRCSTAARTCRSTTSAPSPRPRSATGSCSATRRSPTGSPPTTWSPAARRRARPRRAGVGAPELRRPVGEADELLPASLLAQLERLQLSTRRRLAGRFAGEHRSPHFGASLDFADYREYHPGDDFRRIDYPLYARTGDLLHPPVRGRGRRDRPHRPRPLGVDGLRRQARPGAAPGRGDRLRRPRAARPVTLHTEPLAARRPRFSGRDATRPLFAHLGASTPRERPTSSRRRPRPARPARARQA